MVTHLCNSEGQNPGTLSWIDITTRQAKVSLISSSLTRQEWVDPTEAGETFNPHGGDWLPGVGFLSASFVNPILPPAGQPREYRDDIHFWDVNGDHVDVINMPTSGIQYIPGTIGGGYMDIKWLDRRHAVTCGSLEGMIYLVKPFDEPPYEAVLDIAELVNGGVNTFSGTTIRINKAKDRLVATYGLRYVILVSIDSNFDFDLLDSIDMCAQPGLGDLCLDKDALGPYGGVHYVRMTEDETRVVMTSYYQGYPSIKRVHSFQIGADFNSLIYEESFNPDVEGGNPHGVVYAEWISEEPAGPEDENGSPASLIPSLLLCVLSLHRHSL